jgi:hypothetical protein
MGRGAIASERSGGENIQHFSTIRIRATGEGTLRLAIHSLDIQNYKVLAPLVLQAYPRIQPNRLVNFVEQRASFQLSILDMDNYIRLNRIIVYMKEIYTSHPGA